MTAVGKPGFVPLMLFELALPSYQFKAFDHALDVASRR